MNNKSEVFFIQSRMKGHQSLIDRLGELYRAVGSEFIKEKELTALKIHTGDKGTTNFLRPIFVRKIVSEVLERKGKPFLTDTCTLYHGPRSNGVDFITLAVQNGFDYSVVNAPFIVADGIKSKDVVERTMNLKHFKKVKYGSAFFHSDKIIVLSHFKLHMLSGFGGAIKNISMGMGSRSQKQRMHGDVRPQLKAKNCTFCQECAKVCAVGAIIYQNNLPVIDLKKCTGCAECIATCSFGALKILWNERPSIVAEKMAETSLAIVRDKPNKLLYFNFLLDITPDCDCMPYSDNLLTQNIGILASKDPVAIDQASCDLFNKEPGLKNSRLNTTINPGEDKIRAVYPDIDWENGLIYAEEIGLGSRSYNLKEI